MADLDSKLQNIFDALDEKIETYYENGDGLGIISTELEKWNLLPNPKEKWDESYHIVSSIIEEYLKLKKLDKAFEWANIIQECDPERNDDGQKKFILGKVLFEQKKFLDSYDLFTFGFIDTEGRCFEDEDPKYLDFYKNPEKYIKS